MLTAGWQDRWWGPGHEGSLILSTNARPVPALALQRNRSTPFESRWLSWIGPWTLTTFLGVLDDERVIDDASLFGLRIAFRPVPSLEVGLSRTAQWCGEGRPCDARAFANLLLGKDNRGVNVDETEEPGNQLAGVDLRWVLPGDLQMAVYAQWIGDDTRRGGPEIGNFLRQVGLEHWGTLGNMQHRLHLEVSETSARAGGLGFSQLRPNSAYEHSIYRTGYRYNGRSLGHSMDNDGLSYSVGSTLVQSAGNSWNVSVRVMDINRAGEPDTRHTLSATPLEQIDVQVSHTRRIPVGRIRTGIEYRHIDAAIAGGDKRDVAAFIQWSSQ
ncbi:MAG: capsule assembly Wzi family protein [Woeseiaceae bacterium]|nr:capsule assembly Wzi family protein [Woeseiaceae bacterium]